MSSETDIVIYLMIILIITYSLASLYFFILRYKAREDKARKVIMTLIAFIFLSITVSRIIHLFVIILNGNALLTTMSFENSILFSFSQLALYVGIIGIMFAFERRLEKSERYYATILSSIFCIIYFTIYYISAFNQENLTLDAIEKGVSYIFYGVIYLFTFIMAFLYLNIV